MRRRALAAAVAAAALGTSPWAAPAAWAAFAATVTTSGTSLAAYTVPTPGNIRCSGLTSLASSRILWDAVAPPAGDTIVYAVTLPSGGTTTTSATFYQLPAVTLMPGQYAVQAQISSGWRSAATTITVSLGALGLLYLCRTP
ncbi:MAG TPA: hypothetical protein VFF79_00475 [Conexibacter sp.]|jgi:hypothetical protein|nr:hypothetical protein [Conexibacter sp.]